MLASLSLLYVASFVQADSPGGTGGWSPPLLLAVNEVCHYHTVADLNNDGKPDLIVPSRSGRFHIFMNQGSRQFAPDFILPSVGDLLSVAATDIDNDGDHDLLAVGFGSQTLRIHINDGFGGFSNGPDIALGGQGHGIDVADFDGDGWVDVAVTVAEAVDHAQVLWNDGTGGLLAGPILGTQYWPYYITAADIDSDGDPDIVVSNRNSDSISVHRNDRQLGFTSLPPFSAVGATPGRIEVVDVDVDGNADLLVPHLAVPWVSRFEAIGAGSFAFVESIQGAWSAGVMGIWLDSADLDLDGRVDFVLGPTPDDRVGIALQTSPGVWSAIQSLPAGSSINAVHLVDLDGSGSPDITATALGSGALVLFNNLFNDCNVNGLPDLQDISTGASFDCDGNGVPDECDLASGAEADCNSDGQLDACEIAADPGLDVDVDGTLDLCEIPGTPFCFGDGSIPTLCPCVPPNIVPTPGSAPGHGCANSFNANGALLGSTGTTAPDTVQFTCAISSNYANFALMIKGNASSPNGVQLNDGIMCVSGAIVRFGSHYAATGGAPLGSWTFPNTIQTTPVSIATAQGPAQHAYYQLYYRNAMPNFCTAATANLSNAVDVLW